MSTTTLTNILADHTTRDRLVELAQDYAELSVELEYQKQLFDTSVEPINKKIEEVTKKVKVLGLKNTEFTRISKLLSQSELLYNEAAFLEQLIGLLE